MKQRIVGYARISTSDPALRQQADALSAAGCNEIFEDTVSGSTTSHTGLNACLKSLHAGDTLVVVALDRLSRSMEHLVNTVHGLADQNVGFRSLCESIATTTAARQLILHMFAEQ